MNNRQKAENFLALAKEIRESDESLANWRLEVAKVHSLLAIQEAILQRAWLK